MGDCERFHRIASLGLDGELKPAEAELLEAHARACPACRAYEVGLRRVAAQLRGSGTGIPAFRKRFRAENVKNH